MTVKAKDLKVGMKVKLINKKLDNICMQLPMAKYFGKVCTVREVKPTYFKIEEDVIMNINCFDDGWYWDYEFIEKIVSKKIDKLKKMKLL